MKNNSINRADDSRLELADLGWCRVGWQPYSCLRICVIARLTFSLLIWLRRDGHAGIILTFFATSAENTRCQWTGRTSQDL